MPYFPKFSMTNGRVLWGRMACTAALLLAASTAPAADFGCTSPLFGTDPLPLKFSLPAAGIKINPDVANGTVLYSYETVATGHNFTITTCKNLVGYTPMKRTMLDRAHLGNGVYETGIPGIGLTLSLQGTALPLDGGSGG